MFPNFSLKDSINREYESFVVYKSTGQGDHNNQYVGEIEQQLFVRIKEHVAPTYIAVFKNT